MTYNYKAYNDAKFSVVRWDGEAFDVPNPKWLDEALKYTLVTNMGDGVLKIVDTHPITKTMDDGYSYAEPGDYVVRNEDGHIVAVKLGLFNIIFKKIEDENPADDGDDKVPFDLSQVIAKRYGTSARLAGLGRLAGAPSGKVVLPGEPGYEKAKPILSPDRDKLVDTLVNGVAEASIKDRAVKVEAEDGVPVELIDALKRMFPGATIEVVRKLAPPALAAVNLDNVENVFESLFGDATKYAGTDVLCAPGADGKCMVCGESVEPAPDAEPAPDLGIVNDKTEAAGGGLDFMEYDSVDFLHSLADCGCQDGVAAIPEIRDRLRKIAEELTDLRQIEAEMLDAGDDAVDVGPEHPSMMDGSDYREMLEAAASTANISIGDVSITIGSIIVGGKVSATGTGAVETAVE